MPHYVLEDFVQACKHSEDVYVRPKAMEGAKEFNLMTKKEILEFISSEGLEEIKFYNSKKLDISFFSEEVKVDAYHFSSGFDYGYIAFYQSPNTKKWVLKSFKKDPEADPRNLVLKDDKTLLELKKKLQQLEEGEVYE